MSQTTQTQAQAYQGGFQDPSYDSAHAFRAAMNAMARPGTLESLSGANAPTPISEAAATLLMTVCDPGTGLHLAGSADNDTLRAWITFHTGAPLVSAEEADFALGTWDALQPVRQFKIGDPSYPDRAATLIIEMPNLEQSGTTLSGPGIKTSVQLNLPEVAAFKANRALFPLGFDCFFTCGTNVAALPRSTLIEEAA
ncbi:MAG: phosphonate C-P lyase system protein PhnH [Pseudomonadota bacterium]